MSVTAIGDGSPKSHKKSNESKSADSHAGDIGKVRVKSKKRKHREAIASDALPMNPPKDQAASATQDSSASNPLSPPSAPSAGKIASKNAQLADSATGDTERTPKKKKKKDHLGDVVHGQSKDAHGSDESMKEKKKKKKKKHSDAGEQEGTALEGQVVHLNNPKVHASDEAAVEKSQQKKKRKVEKQLEETPSASKPRKKKKGHRPPDLPFPDPSADESLSDQSRKALSYAYARFQDPPNWKFNKARQIWLIKKLWSEELIPEKHFALVTNYLADVKGGIRDSLVQMCNSVAASVTTDPVTSDSATAPTDLSNGGSVTATKVTRARSLLDALSDVQ
ncbi:uncharacterized protein EDB91DRAFT_416687 [Suillus paluster]|uniref:uncharacterized protein n=1 Tax=Suillus paluster TaxID=48578 RepID=UPI001B85C728|nr:uncharacterized protein EDB91DRAFT_416687 [Suillus paluster]KAG1753779.1 hypothetical protein EDB91DRAFT_416687 [Suillus paluster]